MQNIKINNQISLRKILNSLSKEIDDDEIDDDEIDDDEIDQKNKKSKFLIMIKNLEYKIDKHRNDLKFFTNNDLYLKKIDDDHNRLINSLYSLMNNIIKKKIQYNFDDDILKFKPSFNFSKKKEKYLFGILQKQKFISSTNTKFLGKFSCIDSFSKVKKYLILGDKINSGGECSVFNLINNKKIVAKIYDREYTISNIIKDFVIGKISKHKHLEKYIKILNYMSVDPILVTEKLFEDLSNYKTSCIHDLKNIKTQLFSASNYLNKKRIIHCDINENNVMFTDIFKNKIKIIDLNLAFYIPQNFNKIKDCREMIKNTITKEIENIYIHDPSVNSKIILETTNIWQCFLLLFFIFEHPVEQIKKIEDNVFNIRRNLDLYDLNLYYQQVDDNIIGYIIKNSLNSRDFVAKYFVKVINDCKENSFRQFFSKIYNNINKTIYSGNLAQENILSN